MDGSPAAPTRVSRFSRLRKPLKEDERYAEASRRTMQASDVSTRSQPSPPFSYVEDALRNSFEARMSAIERDKTITSLQREVATLRLHVDRLSGDLEGERAYRHQLEKKQHQMAASLVRSYEAEAAESIRQALHDSGERESALARRLEDQDAEFGVAKRRLEESEKECTRLRAEAELVLSQKKMILQWASEIDTEFASVVSFLSSAELPDEATRTLPDSFLLAIDGRLHGRIRSVRDFLTFLAMRISTEKDQDPVSTALPVNLTTWKERVLRGLAGSRKGSLAGGLGSPTAAASAASAASALAALTSGGNAAVLTRLEEENYVAERRAAALERENAKLNRKLDWRKRAMAHVLKQYVPKEAMRQLHQDLLSMREADRVQDASMNLGQSP